jgi:exodeoxyribonuclease-3
MRVISLNVNGIRAAESKGLSGWLKRKAAPWDVLCMQEVRALPDDVPRRMRAPEGAVAIFHPAEKKGYSGVAIYAKRAPDRVKMGFGCAEFDCEGRYLQADFGKLSIISLYQPSGSAGPHRQASKLRFLDVFGAHLASLRRARREVLLCGDWNMAHQNIDVRNWRSNQKNPGFTPEERAWLTHAFDTLGYVDVFRRLDPRPDQYTWWSNRGQAWKKNVGWRIDYHVATPRLAATARATSIYKDKRFSDHAPLIVDYDYPL